MSKLISTLITAGLVFGFNAAVAQNVESDQDQARGQEQVMQEREAGAAQATPSQASETLRSDNQMGERQAGLEQYLVEQQQCDTMSAGTRQDCIRKARVRYESRAIMQCQLVPEPSRQACYRSIQAAVMPNAAQSNASPSQPAVRGSAVSNTSATDTDQAVRRGEDELKPGRQ